MMKAKKTVDPLPVIPFKSPSDWSDWLEEHHAASGGLWIKFAKKNSGIESVTYAQALDVSLCHGWIDGQKASFDNDFWLQRFTRRGRTSKWSKINRDRGKDHPPGIPGPSNAPGTPAVMRRLLYRFHTSAPII